MAVSKQYCTNEPRQWTLSLSLTRHAEWCAAQFPDHITGFTGYDQAHLMRFRDYVRLEPHLGNYCFRQFPDEMKDQKRELTLSNMATKHVQIEPFFMEWGKQQMMSPSIGSRVQLEPYLAEWCVRGQFKLLFNDKTNSLGNAAANSLHPEGAFARWCFAEFATELATLDEEATVASLTSDHVRIEEYLIKWETAVYGMEVAEDHPNVKKDAGIGFGVGFVVALAILLPIWGLCWCRSRRAAAKDAQFQADVENTQKQIENDSGFTA